MTEVRSADVVDGVTSPDLHRILTVDRGWSSSEWREWVGDTLATQLVPASPGG